MNEKWKAILTFPLKLFVFCLLHENGLTANIDQLNDLDVVKQFGLSIT